MARLRELSHTADVGFEATAATPEELLEVAARGLVGALGLERAAPERSGAAAADGGGDLGGETDAAGDDGDAEEVELSRPDAGRLLVHWLRELLAGATSGRGVPEADVREARLPAHGPASVRARVRWRPASDEGPSREIKGVTYHGLLVERTEDGRWHARVVLDV